MTNNDELALKLKAAADSASKDGRSDDEWFDYLFVSRPANILALLAERDADKKRITELEARTVSVKLPKLKMLEDYLAEVAEEERRQIIIGVRLEFHRLWKEASDAAGIKLEVGE